MVIIDTLGKYLIGEKADGNDYNEMTRVISPLHDIANQRNIAVIACTHTRKGQVGQDWTDSVMGSKAVVAVSDTVLMLTRPMENADGKLRITGRDVEERTLEIEHTEDWFWYDKNAEIVSETLPEFEQWNG
jgi:RecA-family ATPase